MLYESICTKKEFEQNGEKKVVWMQVGTLRTTDEGKKYIELNMFPGTSFYVFPPKEKKEPEL